jgi:hypothetical protein
LRRLASIWLSTGQFRTSCGYAWKGLLLGVDICAAGWLRRELLLVSEQAPLEHFLCRELPSDRCARPAGFREDSLIAAGDRRRLGVAGAQRLPAIADQWRKGTSHRIAMYATSF